jgi:hemerythrin-like metal-binding protein
MAFMTWTEDISVNEEIDAQHRRLFDIVNELHTSVTAGAERSAIAKVFNELVDYTIEHFQTEERYFLSLAYPDSKAHTKEHNDLTEEVARLEGQFAAGDLVISFELLDFLYDWLMKHTSDSDMKFKSFLDGGTAADPAEDRLTTPARSPL